MRLDLSYTYLDTEVEDAGADAAGATYARGERLLRRPTHVAGAAMSWRFVPPLALHAGIIIVGDRDDRRFAGFSSTRVELPSYTKLDMAADYTIRRAGGRRPEVTLAARLDNALDRRYESIAGFRSPGRLATVGVRIGVDF
jgi:vitamin B12 transporter